MCILLSCLKCELANDSEINTALETVQISVGLNIPNTRHMFTRNKMETDPFKQEIFNVSKLLMNDTIVKINTDANDGDDDDVWNL